MRHPDFFDQVKPMVMRDPLAEFLGAFEGGMVQYGYLDAVKLAGHSCPTVAGAYLMTAKALEALYPEETPERGRIRVEFRDDQSHGVTGVIANIACLLTGASQEGGFKGIGGHFDRRKLLLFSREVRSEIRFTRLDTNAGVEVAYHPEHVPPSPDMPSLMQKCVTQTASPKEQAEFARLWQERVRIILVDHWDDPEMVTVTPVTAYA